MTEHHDHGDPTDPLVDQLRRYARGAESLVPATPPRAQRPRSHRPLFVAAAAVVLIAGGLGMVALARAGDDDLESVPADRVAPTSCPGHGPDGPELTAMRQTLPFVATGTDDTETGGDDQVVRLTRTFHPEGSDAELWVQVLTAGFDRGTVGQGGIVVPFESRALTVRMCDPFATHDGGPVGLHASLGRDGASASLEIALGDEWTLLVQTSSAAVTDEMLVQVAEGTVWPGPATSTSDVSPSGHPTPVTGATSATAALGTAERPDTLPGGAPCVEAADDQPEIDGMRISYLPDGFAPAGPARRVLDDLDTATSGSASIELTRSDGASIRVTNFWSDAPDVTVDHVVDAASAYHVSLLRCPLDQHGDPAPDHLGGVRMAESTDGVVVVGQDGGHGGFIVRGGPGVTRDLVLEVASGLR